MDNYRPSQFDRFLEQVDRLFQRGFALVTGEEPMDFDHWLRRREFMPVRIDRDPRRNAHRSNVRAARRPF